MRYRFSRTAILAVSNAAVCLAAITAGLTCTTCLAYEGDSPATTQSLFLRHLQRPVTLTWRKAPIRSSLQRLGRIYQVAVVVDRHVDPSRSLDLSVQQSPLLRVLVAAAVQSDLHIEIVGPTIYVGPKAAARLGPILLEIANAKIAKLPSRQRDAWNMRRAVQIDHLGEPRVIIEQLCKSRNIGLANRKKVPHDLWEAQTWPRLTLSESLTLLLLGFDMTFDVSPTGECRVKPIDWTTRITHKHSVNLNHSHHADLVAAFPDAKIGDSDVELSANLDVHADLRAWIQARQNGSNPANNKLRSADQLDLPKSYSLEIKNQPLKPIAAGLLRRLGMDVEFDADIPAAKLEQRISFKVSNASFDEMISAMLQDVSLKFTVEGSTVRIHP